MRAGERKNKRIFENRIFEVLAKRGYSFPRKDNKWNP